MKLCLFLIIFFVARAQAHPVIYKDGLALSSSNMPAFSNNYGIYSVTPKTAIGLDHWRFTRDVDSTDMGFLKLNHILYRHNGEDSQANLYLHTGLGLVDQGWENRGTHGISQVGLEAD